MENTFKYRRNLIRQNQLFSALFGMLVMLLILTSGCKEKKENPIILQPSINEWTCEECHTNQAKLALLAEYLVGDGEAGEG